MSHLGAVILGAVVFFVLILVSIGLHELGHFLPGKLFRIRILQFFIGFGRTLWSTRKGETEYGVKLIPLGGYVRLLGMYPPKRVGPDTRLKRLADAAREGEWENITESDVAGRRLFYQKPLWQRLVVMFSGVAVNLLLAFLLFLGVNLAFGQPEVTTRIATVEACADPAEPAAGCQPSPAAAMGLQPDDQVVAVNGQAVSQWAEVTKLVRDNGARPIQVTVLRDGESLDLPQVGGRIAAVADPDQAGQTVQAGWLGVTAQQAMVKAGPAATWRQMWSMTVQSVQAILRLPVTAVTTLTGMIAGQPRGADSPVSIVGASVVAGDVAAADQASVGSRVATYLQLLGSINLFVGLMNLVPLPPFDGGQVAAGIYEAIRRGLARLRGRPDPGPADTAKLLPVTYLVAGLLVVIGLILIVADIVNPVALF